MIAIELTAAINATPTLQTFYVSTDRLVTLGTDTPANVAFIPKVVDPGTISVSVFSDGVTTGGTNLDVGEIVLSNADGYFDPWLNYSFDGRAVVIRQGTAGDAYPSAWSTLFTGTVANVAADRSKFMIRLKDKQHLFESQMLTTVYAGTNALPNGIEGTANDVKGQVKPILYGKVFNIDPPCVNTSKLIYQISSSAIASVDGVYDRGAAITAAGDYATNALLQAATPTTGTYITCLAEGLFRLGGSPAGQVTCDATQGVNAAARTAGQILKNIALLAGAGTVDMTALSALDAANSAVCGIWVNDESSFQDAMDAVAKSIGAWYGFNPAGALTLGIWTAPSGTAVATLGEYYIGKDYERRAARDNAAPVWSVSVNYARYYVQQSNDLAGSVTDARKAILTNEYRSATSTDSITRGQFLLATSIQQDTCLTVESDAMTEAVRLLALHKVRRDMFDLPIPVQLIAQYSLVLGSVVTLQMGRFGFSGGKLMRVMGIRLDLARARATLTVWG